MSAVTTQPETLEQSNLPIAHGALRPPHVLHRFGVITSSFVSDDDQRLGELYGFTLDAPLDRSDQVMDAAMAKAQRIKTEMKPAAQGEYLDKLYDTTAEQIRAITSESVSGLAKVETRLTKALPVWPEPGESHAAVVRAREIRDELRRLPVTERLIVLKDAASKGRIELLNSALDDPMKKLVPATLDSDTLKSKALRAAYPKSFDEVDRLMRLKSLINANGQIYLKLINRADKGMQVASQGR